jgi:hypothetical protein
MGGSWGASWLNSWGSSWGYEAIPGDDGGTEYIIRFRRRRR